MRCFNCDHTGRRHEDFFNITKSHPSFAEKADSESDETGQDRSLKENAFLVCGECVYDRLQECHSCAKKAPLCMFKIAEWFSDKKNRNCIDCAATFEALGLFQTGYHSSVIIRQCTVCRHFKYLPSFISWRKHQPHDTLKDCFECQLRGDIVQYKRELRDRYEEKLQQEPVLGDDNQPSRTGGEERCKETIAQQGATYASVVSKGFTDSKSSSSMNEDGHLRTTQITAQLNVPTESGLHKGKCFSTGLEGKRRRINCRCFYRNLQTKSLLQFSCLEFTISILKINRFIFFSSKRKQHQNYVMIRTSVVMKIFEVYLCYWSILTIAHSHF